MPETAAFTETAASARLAETIAAARLARHPLPPQARNAPRDVAEAYAVQGAVHRRLVASPFGARTGWKIGCTTPVMQAYLGIEHPCAAGLFAGSTHAGGAVLRHGDFVRVGVECEIAVRLARDLTDEEATTESVRGAVGAVMAAIEIVDDRYVDWQSIGTPMLVADDFFAAGSVLGGEQAPGALPDLAGLRGRTLIDGVEAGSGVGADVLGHPYAALAWLAVHAADRGQPLRAGETVLLGSLVKTQWVPAGATVRVEIEALGAVEVHFTAG
ncbi:2-keto-4-pentenoate hydratase [Bosea sp. (in: a-proteobacteria)]|uniref:2-keto-4-pentenoate hydratase n=1 Tax=Bosea sp. (in: a-proteobacteria) TaxID=1871050 RepID=UPI002FC8CB19